MAEQKDMVALHSFPLFVVLSLENIFVTLMFFNKLKERT